MPDFPDKEQFHIATVADVDAPDGLAEAMEPWNGPLTALLSSVSNIIESPGTSARLVADLREWSDTHLPHATAEGFEMTPGWFVPIGGGVFVSTNWDGGSPARVEAGAVRSWAGRFRVRSPTSSAVALLGQESISSLLGLFQTARLVRQQARGLLPKLPLRHHHVWVCGDSTWKELPLAALAHLLASAIATQFREAAVVVEVAADRSCRIGRHVGARFEDHGTLPEPPSEATLLRHLEATSPIRPRFHHVLHVCPATPEEYPENRPAGGYDWRFDRIVHFGRKLDLRAAKQHSTRLKRAAQNRDDPANPYFSSFVSTFLDHDREQLHKDLRPGGFDRLVTEPGQRPPGWRLLRDACWLDVTIETVNESWRSWSRSTAGRPFAACLDPAGQPSLERWARAVTNRQVGLALSGGGASSFRFIPALERFAEPTTSPNPNVVSPPTLPIDVLSGVSGGALIGAYFCRFGVEGCDRAMRDGAALQLALPSVAVWSKILEWMLDYNLGTQSIAKLPVRFVPVAVCLMRGAPPETRVLLNLRIGEAVLASGSLPVVFGPTSIRGEAYTDGAFGSIIPSLAVSLYGADFVVAMNCIAGPSLGDPYERSRLVQLLRTWTPVGRFIDLWVSIAYLQQQTSRLVGRTDPATILIEPSPTEVPFKEMPAFGDAEAITMLAREDAQFMSAIEDAVARWNVFRDFGADLPREPPFATKEKLDA